MPLAATGAARAVGAVVSGADGQESPPTEEAEEVAVESDGGPMASPPPPPQQTATIQDVPMEKPVWSTRKACGLVLALSKGPAPIPFQ